MPLILFIVGWLCYLFPNNTVFEIAAAISSLVIVRATYLIIMRLREFRYTWITGCGLLLGYGIGTLNPCLQLMKNGETLTSHFYRTQVEFSEALAIVIWVSGTLFLVGMIAEKPIRFDLSRLTRSDTRFIYIGLVIALAALATGQIGYMGASVSDDRHVTVLGSISGLIAPLLPPLTVLMRGLSRILKRRLFFWAIFLTECAIVLPLGRRVLIYACFLAVMAFKLRGDSWKSPYWKKALVISTALMGMYLANMFFYAMRHIAMQSGAATRMGAPDVDTKELVGGALDFIKNGRSSSFDQELADNLRDRTFILPYLSDVISHSKTYPTLHGRVVLFALEMATPTIFYPNKAAVLDIGMEEYLANPRLGLTLNKDESNSILTSAASDFGIAGAFIYPILICLFLNFSLRLLLPRNNELVRLMFFLSFAFYLFQTEMSFTALVVQFRNVAILLMVWIPAEMMLRFIMKSRGKSTPAPQRFQPALIRYGTTPRRGVI